MSTSLKTSVFGNGTECSESDVRARECFVIPSNLNCEIRFTNFFSFFFDHMMQLPGS